MSKHTASTAGHRWGLWLVATAVAMTACAGATDDDANNGDGTALSLPDGGLDVFNQPANRGTTAADAASAASQSDASTGGEGQPEDAASACPGGPACSCAANDDCDNALCIDTPAGKQCARKCIDSCPEQFTCAPVTAGGGDVVTICVPAAPHLCDPCTSSKDCTSLGIDSAACVDQGSKGAFCGLPCGNGEKCPDAYECKAIKTIEGGDAKMCVRLAQSASSQPQACICNAAASKAKLSTPCFVEHYSPGGKQLVGKCPGTRTCGPDGLGTCVAAKLDVEMCDGVDNDCDGQTDEGTCDDGNPCTKGVCGGEAGCSVSKLDGSPCDADSNLCTVNDNCDSGVCVAGSAKNCDDGNSCTLDTCALSTGCTQTADTGKPCDADGSLCTVGDICQGTSCQAGAIKSCDDDNPCTIDACDLVSGKCAFKPGQDDISCDDENACTVSDACKSGTCVGKKLNCDDKNPCTAITCDVKAGCQKKPLDGAACDDENPCTIGDVCKSDSCVSGKLKSCALSAPCEIGKCKTSTGKCVYTDRAEGESCNDGNKCTTSDACASGTCKGKALNCNDNNPCTNDSCDPKLGCKPEPVNQACDDGNKCITSDFCKAGKCIGQPQGSGPCDDGNKCTGSDTCKAGTCKGVPTNTKVACDDGNTCTNDGCDPILGCTHIKNNSPCNDADPCTKGEVCLAGACKAGNNLCECKKNSDCAGKEDGNLCNGTLRCDTSKVPYTCALKPGSVVVCNNPINPSCGTSKCVPKTGKCAVSPINEGGACNADNNTCTVNDTCVKGNCNAGAPKNCNDNEICTVDSCDKGTGCFHTKLADGTLCGSGKTCQAGKCQNSCSSGSKSLNYTGGHQSLSMPGCAQNVTIEAYGAKGGDKPGKPGGKGAYMKAVFNNLAGQTLRIIVGGRGQNVSCGLCGGGGGGGSFISIASNNQLLLVAGGGGGTSYQGHVGQGGQTTEQGGKGGYSSAINGSGGKSANDGGGGTGCGGGGWNGKGTNNNWCTGGQAKGGAGGSTKHSTGKGGYGGGGGSYHGGGGGGGYSGGGGGKYTIGGGGGGSYTSGQLVTSVGAQNSGDGRVVISW